MSWRARERKKFNRLVKRLKAAPVYTLGPYTIIDADIIFLKKGHRDVLSESRMVRERSFQLNILNGTIQTEKDFDSIYNPSLTLDIAFEDSTNKIKELVCTVLDEIAASWKAKLLGLGLKDKRLFRYYDADAEEWSLEFLNSEVSLSTIRGKYPEVKVFIPELCEHDAGL